MYKAITMVLRAGIEFFSLKIEIYFSQLFFILIMDICENLLAKNFNASRILLNNALEFVCDYIIITFYKYSSGAETSATLFYYQHELKIKGEHLMRKWTSNNLWWEYAKCGTSRKM